MNFPKLLDACKKISRAQRTSSMKLVVITVNPEFLQPFAVCIVGNAYNFLLYDNEEEIPTTIYLAWGIATSRPRRARRFTSFCTRF